MRARRVLEEATVRLGETPQVPEAARPYIGAPLNEEEHRALVDYIVEHQQYEWDCPAGTQLPARAEANGRSVPSGTAFRPKLGLGKAGLRGLDLLG